jgi:uncharacterized protein (TIGR03435 family)
LVAKGGPRIKKSASDPGLLFPPADASKLADKSSIDTVSIPTAEGNVKITRSAQGASLEMLNSATGGTIRMVMNVGTGAQLPGMRLESAGITMKALAEVLSGVVADRPIVDMTGLTGYYEVALNLSLEGAMNVARSAGLNIGGGAGVGSKAGVVSGEGISDLSGSSILASIASLGLKLEPRKLPFEMMVVDHMEKTPAGN